MFTSQRTPNRSVHMPNVSPHCAFVSGIITLPPSASWSKYPRSWGSSSPLSDIEMFVPGVYSIRLGVSAAMNLPGWGGSFNMRKSLEKSCGAAVRLGNDVQVATDAEFALGSGRPYNSLLGVFWGTGVGGGIVLDGKPWIGRDVAGEIGHVVVRIGGALCGCGRRGCMEAYAGRASMEARARRRANKGEKTVLFKIMEERGRTRLSSGVWARALDRGDPARNRSAGTGDPGSTPDDVRLGAKDESPGHQQS